VFIARSGGLNLNDMSEAKFSRTVVVINPQGLHARPADLIVKAACRFQSQVEIVKGQERVDAKSMLAIFTLAALPGTELVVEAEGPDAAEAVDALCELFGRGFDELEHKSENT
jgi:phosphotransferase system HPr (HPr) family protein